MTDGLAMEGPNDDTRASGCALRELTQLISCEKGGETDDQRSPTTGSAVRGQPKRIFTRVIELLDRDGRRKIDEPLLEDLGLVFGDIDERDPHANSFLHVEDLALGLERALIAGDAQLQHGACGKDVRHVHKTPLAADFRDPTGKPRSA